MNLNANKSVRREAIFEQEKEGN